MINTLKQIPENEGEWEARLTPEQYEVLRNKATEAPFSGELLKEKRAGGYYCMACGNQLFDSSAKFDSGTGWPSFDEAIPGAVHLIDDMSLGMHRVEVTCARCNSHLGHVFTDGPTPTHDRYCMNSVCLEFKPSDTH